jgi:aspartyl-tRNA(Asn)/glutamyl-tRNA(Gln) amidotransferase subunit C
MISKKDVEKLAELSRIKLTGKEKTGLVADLEKILAHFEELGEVDVAGVEPVSGGGDLVNAVREDDSEVRLGASRDDLVDAFPVRDGDYLKVPPVFE